MGAGGVTWIKDVLTRPRTWLWYHATWSVVWSVLFPPAVTWWRDSVPFLMFVSMQTALGGALAGVAAALGGMKADPEDPT